MAAADGAPPPGLHGHKPKKGSWLQKNKGMAVAVGAGGVLGLIVLIMRHGQAGSSQPPGGTGSTVDPSLYGVPGAPGRMADYSSYDQYAGEMSQLQDLLNAYTAGTLGSQLGVTAPAAGSPGPAGPAGPAGSPGPAGSGSKSKPGVPSRTITVPRGATLLSLSQQYLGTSNRSALAHANGLGTGSGLRAGQKLTIPAH